MKYIMILFLVSCSAIGQNPEGIYTCQYEHEFAFTEDTLRLQIINDNYIITRHSGVHIKTSGKYKLITELWKLRLDKNVFTDLKSGRSFSWDSNRQLLIFGNRQYVKMKM